MRATTKIVVLERFCEGDALEWIQLQHLVEQIESHFGQLLNDQFSIWKLRKHIAEMLPRLSQATFWTSPLRQDLEDLPHFRIASEQGVALTDLSEHTADCPHIHLVSILLRSQQYLGGFVPQCRDLLTQVEIQAMTQSRLAEIAELDGAISCNQHILRLDVAVDDPLDLQKAQDIQELPNIVLNCEGGERVVGFAVIEQVLRHEVHREEYLRLFPVVVHIVDLDYVRVFQMLQQADLTEGIDRHTFIFLNELDLLHRNSHLKFPIKHLVYTSECPLTQFLYFFVAI